jgi:Spy/CpxP family protein refolding chaperone
MNHLSKFNRNTLILVAAGALAFTLAAPRQLFAKQLSEAVTAVSDDDNFAECFRKHFEKRFFKSIAATPDQEQKLAALIDGAAQANKPIRAEIKQKAESLLIAFADENESAEQIRNKVADLRTLRDQLADRRLATVLKARDILTAEQKKSLTDKIRQRLDGCFGQQLLRTP